jgi:hypothetical protein
MTGLTATQLQAYRDVLKAGKVAPDKLSTEWVFQRAWNEGVEFAERQLDKTIRETA